MIKSNFSLEDFQKLIRKIYLVTNDRNYSSIEIFSHLHRYITQILKAVRKGKYDNIEYHLCMAFSWSVALANRFHIDLTNETWSRFPGICPYCLGAPCTCIRRAKERRRTPEIQKRKQPVSLSDWQKMFHDIYPNVLINSAVHLAEEAGEVDEAIRNYSAVHSNDWFDRIVEELVDVISNIYGVANCLRFNLADGLADYFVQGCLKCHKPSCGCGYVTIDNPIRAPKKIQFVK